MLVEGRRIAAVGDHASGAEAAYELRGLTSRPGLIDARVHVRAAAGETPTSVRTRHVTTATEEQLLHALRSARRVLSYGVTTLRAMAGDQLNARCRSRESG